MMRRLDLRSDLGQSLLTLLIALPVMIAFTGLVIDSANAFAKKRAIQNAADASALAAALDLEPVLACADDVCRESYRATVQARAEQYSLANGGPPTLAKCDDEPTNCYTWPYNGSYAKIEVRLEKPTRGFFTRFLGLALDFFKPAARAVASAAPVSETHCDYSQPVADPDPECEMPGEPTQGDFDPGTDSHCVFAGEPPVDDPDQYLVLDPPCVIPGQDQSGIFVPGHGSHCEFPGEPPVEDPDQYRPECVTPGRFIGGDGGVAFAKSTNCDFDHGGSAITYSGAGGGTIGALTTNGGITVSGNSGKTISRLALGRNGEVSGNKKCYDNPGNPPLATILNPPIQGPWSPPKDWLQPLPPIPTPPGGCTSLGNVNITFSTTGRPPGVYCVTGTTATLTVAGDLSAGYTFFAPIIQVNGGSFRCYQFCAVGDPGPNATLFYATIGDVKVQGSGPSLTGNIFAPSGEISFTGGGATGGKGYLESLTLKLAGNFASYFGTGPGGTGHFEPGRTGTFVPAEDSHCTFDPPVPDPDSYRPECVVPGQARTGEVDPGADAHCVFDPPVPDPDSYLPTCQIPDEDTQGKLVTSVTGTHISMDE